MGKAELILSITPWKRNRNGGKGTHTHTHTQKRERPAPGVTPPTPLVLVPLQYHRPLAVLSGYYCRGPLAYPQIVHSPFGRVEVACRSKEKKERGRERDDLLSGVSAWQPWNPTSVAVDIDPVRYSVWSYVPVGHHEVRSSFKIYLSLCGYNST